MNSAFLACCLLAQMAFTARGDDGGSELTLRHCLIDYAQSSMVGASELGVIQESHVQRGSVVRAGQVLAHLPDGEVRAKLDQCKIEATSDLDYKLHVLHHKQAVNKLRISTNLRSRQALSYEAYLADYITAELAAVEVDLAKQRQVLNQAKLEEAEARFKARQIISPHDGVIGEVLRKQGESVSLGVPAFRVDNPEWLLITGKFDVSDLYRVKVGQPVRAVIQIDGADLPIERERFVGTITYIDPKFDKATQLCTVMATVENRDRLYVAGLEAVMIITTPSQPNSAPAPTPIRGTEAMMPRTIEVRRDIRN